MCTNTVEPLYNGHHCRGPAKVSFSIIEVSFVEGSFNIIKISKWDKKSVWCPGVLYKGPHCNNIAQQHKYCVCGDNTIIWISVTAL